MALINFCLRLFCFLVAFTEMVSVRSRGMDHSRLSIVESIAASGPVLSLVGELDFSTAQRLQVDAERCLSQPPDRLVLDFSGVTFCDSQGLATLVAVRRLASAAGVSVTLTNVGEIMRRLLDITGLLDLFPTDASP